MVLLEVNNLTKKFGGLMAVDGVDFSLEKGEILGMIGPNGAGKTTLFNVLTGFYPCDNGRITFKGEEITGLRPDQIAKKGITRTFQIVKPFTNITVFQNVVIGAHNRIKDLGDATKIALETLEYTGLAHTKDQTAANLPTPQRKRLELAKALASQPELILLDEVASGLNPKETQEIIALIQDIREKGITIFVIEHVMKAIMSFSDRIIVLHHGKKIATGTPSEISRSTEVIKAYLGKEYLLA